MGAGIRRLACGQRTQKWQGQDCLSPLCQAAWQTYLGFLTDQTSLWQGKTVHKRARWGQVLPTKGQILKASVGPASSDTEHLGMSALQRQIIILLILYILIYIYIHPSIHPPIHSSIPTPMNISHPPIPSTIHPFIHLSTQSQFIHQPTHPPTHLLIHPSTHHPPTYSSIHPPILHPPTIHPPTYPPTHPPTTHPPSIRPFTHLSIHPPVCDASSPQALVTVLSGTEVLEPGEALVLSPCPSCLSRHP